MAESLIAGDNLLLKFDKFVIFYNPLSTNSRRSRKRITELKELFPSKDVQIIETSPDGLAANKKLVARAAKKFDQQTLVCIAAGDGTVSAVLDALFANDSTVSDQAKKVPILPLWGGNANDLAYMINGRPKGLSLKNIFEKGQIVPIYPLTIKLSSNEGTDKRIAACYVSFGASAYVASQLDLPRHRRMTTRLLPGARLVAEFLITTRSLIKAPAFTISTGHSQEPVYERIFINGSRIAKIDRLPSRLNEKAFYEATLERKHPKSLISLLSALKILRNRTYGEITEKDRSFSLNDDTWAQVDGEVMKLPKNMKVEISLSETPFYVVSTKLG